MTLREIIRELRNREAELKKTTLDEELAREYATVLSLSRIYEILERFERHTRRP